MKRKFLCILCFISCFLMTFSQHKNSNYFSENPTCQVLIFYSTTCPICQKMTLALNQLQSQFKDSGVTFKLIFPASFESKKSIQKFKNKYKIKFECALDIQNKLVNQCNATVTPECFLIDSKGQILYSGKIDNWFYDIGKYRQVITEKYLQDAIVSTLENKPVLIKRTEPIGCFISR